MPKQLEAMNAATIRKKWLNTGRSLTNTEINNLFDVLETSETKLKAINNIASTNAITNSVITKEEKLWEIQSIAVS